MTRFSRTPLQMTKNGSFMTTLIQKDNLCNIPQRQCFIEEKLGCVCMVESTRYHLSWILQPHSDSQMTTYTVHLILSQCLHENLPRKGPTCINRRNIVLLFYNERPHSTRITQEKNIGLSWSVQPYPPHLSEFTQRIFMFSLINKMFSKKNNFSRRSCKNVRRKLLQLKTNWILLKK